METKHTKGKLKICFDEILNDKIIYTDGKFNESKNIMRKKCICSFPEIRGDSFTGISTEEIEANVKLFAAASEMLEALQHALNIVDLWYPETSMEAIKECDISEFAALSNMRTDIEKAIKKATE